MYKIDEIRNKIIQGDCIEVMKQIPDNSIDLILTDPPYGIANEVKITKGNSEWEGYGTSLKPSFEPIIMAMKPNDKTYVNNALKWGVAGLNIDEGRIGAGRDLEDINRSNRLPKRESNLNYYSKTTQRKMFKDRLKNNKEIQGRFPANLILDEEAGKMLDEQSGISKSTGGRVGKKDKSNIDFGLSGKYKKGDPGFGDIGGASRFFYCAKASKSERTANGTIKAKHPTVKPIKLMEYLAKLTKTPTGGVVLDPFLGSGTTAIACLKTGRNFIGVEKNNEYIEIAKQRIAHFENKITDLAKDNDNLTC